MTYPEQLTLSEARSGSSPDTTLKSALAFLDGDHWQQGWGWVGPRLPADNPLAADFLLNVQQQFTPKNAIGEITGRHVGAVVGRYPVIKLALRDATATPTDKQKSEIKLGEGALTAWLDTVNALSKIQQFTLLLLLPMKPCLRSYIPSGEVPESGVIPVAPLLDSIERIRLMVPEPGAASVVDDEETGRRYAVFRTQTRAGQQVVEISYLNQGRETVLRRLQAQPSATLLGPDGNPASLGGEQKTKPLNMNGLLTITTAERKPLVTPTLLANQKMLSFAKTAILRNAELAAVLERYGINILPPGDWVKDIQAPSGMRYVPKADWRPGGAQASFMSPSTFVDEQGRMQVTGGGQYGRFEPVKPDALIATKSDAYHDMLDEAGQSHIKISGDATSSGEARIQAMNDFKVSLYATATPVEGALSQHLEMVLAWAASLSGAPGRFREYRVVVQCRILAAQPTTLERAQIIAERDAGLRSTEDAMSQIGVEDTDQMLAAVKTEKEEAVAQGQAAANSLAKLMTPPTPPPKTAP